MKCEGCLIDRSVLLEELFILNNFYLNNPNSTNNITQLFPNNTLEEIADIIMSLDNPMIILNQLF
jgi:hypothetical protein